MESSRRTPREAADALVEAVAVIRAMWSRERSLGSVGRAVLPAAWYAPRPGTKPTSQDLTRILRPEMSRLTGQAAAGGYRR